MKITLKDIARKAEVSVSAVSLALNGKTGVSVETRQKVLNIAQKHGYQVPSARQAGADFETAEIGVVKVLKIVRHGHTINVSHNFFIDSYIEGIHEIAHEKGITIEVGTFAHNVKMSTIVDSMRTYTPTLGYLILGTELSEDDMDAILTTQNNVVFMDTFVDYIPAHFVNMNNTDTVYRAIRHLVEYGHTRIGLIKSSVRTKNFSLREHAFHQVMGDLGLEVNSSYIIDVDSTFEGAYRDMLSHLDRGGDLPSAFFATNDVMALGCMKALHKKGVNIPRDLSIVGFDNLPMSEMFNPPLTTIDIHKHKIAQHALTILLSNNKNEPCVTAIKMLIDGHLVSRSSVRRLNA